MRKVLRPIPKSEGKGFHIVGDEKKEAVHPFVHPRLGSTLAMGFAGISPLPHTLRTKLKYAEHVVITGTSGALGLYVFNASSLYDPNYTGTGHQPRGFDQLMPLYDHFVVTKSRAKVQFVPTSTSATMAGIAVSATVNNQGDWDDYAEGPYSVCGALDAAVTSGGLRVLQLDISYDAKKNLGIPDPLTADKLQGTISANPVDNAFYHIFIQHAGETNSVSCNVLVEIEYECAFIEPLNPAQS
jgi:hypothetical protein